MLRCYAAANASASQAFKVRRAKDNTESDIGLTSSCDFDSATALTFATTDATGTGAITGTTLTFTGGHTGDTITGGTTAAGTYIIGGSSPSWTVNISQTVASTTLTLTWGLYISKAYDQSGNARDIAQATAANQPQLFLNGGGPSGTLPYIRFITANSQLLTGSNIGNTAVPISFSTVINRDITTNNSGNILNINDINPCLEFTGAANQVQMYNGTALLATVSDNAWHTLQAVANGASGVVNVDGTETTGNTGSNGTSGGGVISIGARAGSANVYMTAIGTEWIIWLSGLSSGNRTSIKSNQHTYWGF